MTDEEIFDLADDYGAWQDDFGRWNFHPEGLVNFALVLLRVNAEQQEPAFECPRCGHCCQQREWVGLTDEELKQAYLEVSGNEWCLGGISNAESFYDAIEAKLKEKNHE